MTGERRVRILSRLIDTGGYGMDAARMCVVGAELTGMTGAGIMLMSTDTRYASLCSTDATSARIEELQFELGEGPCTDAFRRDEPVYEPDLAAPATPRWVAFSGPAVAAGVAAIFGFPLRIGAVRLGALDLYRHKPGAMSDEQHADALVMADIVAHTIVALQADASPGQLAAALERGADFHQVVHQATGMVAAQLDVDVSTALIRLRAHAFGNDHPLLAVAKDVVARSLRFDDASGEDDSTLSP